MNYFSSRSEKQLSTCDCKLQLIMRLAIKEYDFSVLCGHRGEEEQNAAFEMGFSKLKYPQSKHNQFPSLAVDIAPYPIRWDDVQRFIDLSKVIKRIAKEQNIKIKWGGDWKRFKDYPHWELVECKN